MPRTVEDIKVEDTENGVSSSPFTKSDSDVDGKGQNYERMGIILSNQKKVGMKGSTSPAISASSKAFGQSKTILSERNETQMEAGSDLDPKSFKGALSSRQSGSLSREDSALNKSKESSVNDGLSTDQYDPFTNYLSPRPKFLRYRPNRSWEIFLRQQNEVDEEIFNGTALNDEHKVLLSSGSSSSEEISENEQEEEEEEREEDSEEIEEDDEEFEEDKGWTLKRVFKVLALLMATVLYATYLSSTNTDSMSSHSFRSNEVLSNGTCSVQGWKKEAEFASKLLRESDFLDPRYGRRKVWREEEVEMIDDRLENKNLNENKFFHEEEVGGFTDQLAEVAELKDEDTEAGGFEGGGKDGEVAELELEYPFHCKEPTETKILENVFETNDDQKPFTSEVSMHSEIDADKELAKTKTDCPEKMARSDLNFFHLVRMLRERNYLENRIVENMKTQLFFQILSSFLAFLLLLIVSVVCYQSKKKGVIEKQQFQIVEALEQENENTLEKTSPLTVKAWSESVIIEENDSIISWEGRSLAPIWLEEKYISTERYYNSRAPTVELLGELVVGGETGNSLKNRMIESKDSNNLVSIEECSVYSRPALSELSNSPSHGSFTAEKIVNKEVGRGGDSKVISTPVRRSSRIKNRAAMSP